MQKFSEIKNHFDSLNPYQQWAWIVSNIGQIKFEITLDNDNTTILFDGDENADYMLYLKEDCGNRAGVHHILSAMGANVEHC